VSDTSDFGDRQRTGDALSTVQKLCVEDGAVTYKRSRKYHLQTIAREKRDHGSLKLEHLYPVLPNNRTSLI
jgi:hypothetical protein